MNKLFYSHYIIYQFQLDGDIKLILYNTLIDVLALC
jgi:hypothetical protein